MNIYGWLWANFRVCSNGISVPIRIYFCHFHIPNFFLYIPPLLLLCICPKLFRWEEREKERKREGKRKREREREKEKTFFWNGSEWSATSWRRWSKERPTSKRFVRFNINVTQLFFRTKNSFSWFHFFQTWSSFNFRPQDTFEPFRQVRWIFCRKHDSPTFRCFDEVDGSNTDWFDNWSTLVVQQHSPRIFPKK